MRLGWGCGDRVTSDLKRGWWCGDRLTSNFFLELFKNADVTQVQQHNDVTSGRLLGFSNSNLNTKNSEKTTVSYWNLQNCKIHCKISSI